MLLPKDHPVVREQLARDMRFNRQKPAQAEAKTGQDYVQERENLLNLIKLSRHALVIMLVLLLGMVIGALAGCAPVNTDPFAQVQPPAFTPSSSDMGAYDEHIVALCEAQAMSVTFDLVTMAPEEFTVEEVVAVVDYLYSNCLRDNGRGA